MASKNQLMEESKKSNFRWVIVSLLFFATAINYADRTVLSIAGPALAKSLHLDSVSMGYIFSAFGWSYVLAQLPGGWLLDRFGSRKIYAISLFVWSFFTFITGFTGFFVGFSAVVAAIYLKVPFRYSRSTGISGKQQNYGCLVPYQRNRYGSSYI